MGTNHTINFSITRCPLLLLIGACIVASSCFIVAAQAQLPAATTGAVLVATKSADSITIESKGGSLTYKAVVDAKKGGDITEVQLPTDGPVIAREVNDIFFLGEHTDQFTLRGWTGPAKFNISCSLELLSQKPDEVVVRVNLLTTGTFKILATDEPAKTDLRKAHTNYKEKALHVNRTYTFKPDRILFDDQMMWLYPDAPFKTYYLTSAFMPGAIQGRVRFGNAAGTADFDVTTSGGKKIPSPITYPFTATNYLKNGYVVASRTTTVSFDIAKSDFYFYEKPWQQDWFQLSGFMFRIAGYPPGKPVAMASELTFAKASAAEMPPVVTIQSPSWDARWLDERGEVAKYKIGDTVKLSASAKNSDGTPVPDSDITWEIHIDPWWNTPTATLHGNNISYKIPEVTDEKDKITAKDRNLLAVFSVKVKGKNGTEAAERFAMLVGKGDQ